MMHLALILLAAGVAPPVPVAASSAQREQLANWPTRFALALPDAKPSTLVGVTLLPAVFGKATPNLADLRLIDAGGTSIPFALRIRTPRDVPAILLGKPINAGVRPDGTLECSLDLGERPGEHNEIFVPLGGRSYHRPVRIEGSDDGKTWNSLLEDVFLVNLAVAGQQIDKRRFSYPPSRYRYLRVQVGRDLQPDIVPSRLESFQVLRNIRVPGATDTYPGQMIRSDSGRYQNSYATATLIDLGADRVPVSSLLIDVDEREFNRPYFLEAEDAGGWRLISQGEFQPNIGGGAIVLNFPEAPARRLRLQIIDSSNTPLTIRTANFVVVRREVLFRMPVGATMPLYFYTGNPQSQPPNYDIETQLSLDAKAEVSATVGPSEINPAYLPPPIPWSEQHPRLIDGVLGFAGLVLAAILAALARAAIRRQETPKAAVA